MLEIIINKIKQFIINESIGDLIFTSFFKYFENGGRLHKIIVEINIVILENNIWTNGFTSIDIAFNTKLLNEFNKLNGIE